MASKSCIPPHGVWHVLLPHLQPKDRHSLALSCRELREAVFDWSPSVRLTVALKDPPKKQATAWKSGLVKQQDAEDAQDHGGMLASSKVLALLESAACPHLVLECHGAVQPTRTWTARLLASAPHLTNLCHLTLWRVDLESIMPWQVAITCPSLSALTLRYCNVRPRPKQCSTCGRPLPLFGTPPSQLLPGGGPQVAVASQACPQHAQAQRKQGGCGGAGGEDRRDGEVKDPQQQLIHAACARLRHLGLKDTFFWRAEDPDGRQPPASAAAGASPDQDVELQEPESLIRHMTRLTSLHLSVASYRPGLHWQGPLQAGPAWLGLGRLAPSLQHLALCSRHRRKDAQEAADTLKEYCSALPGLPKLDLGQYRLVIRNPEFEMLLAMPKLVDVTLASANLVHDLSDEPCKWQRLVFTGDGDLHLPVHTFAHLPLRHSRLRASAGGHGLVVRSADQVWLQPAEEHVCSGCLHDPDGSYKVFEELRRAEPGSPKAWGAYSAFVTRRALRNCATVGGLRWDVPHVAITHSHRVRFEDELVEMLALLSDKAPYCGVHTGPKALWFTGIDLNERLLGEGLIRHLGGQLEKLMLTSSTPSRQAWAGLLEGLPALKELIVSHKREPQEQTLLSITEMCQRGCDVHPTHLPAQPSSQQPAHAATAVPPSPCPINDTCADSPRGEGEPCRNMAPVASVAQVAQTSRFTLSFASLLSSSCIAADGSERGGVAAAARAALTAAAVASGAAAAAGRAEASASAVDKTCAEPSAAAAAAAHEPAVAVGPVRRAAKVKVVFNPCARPGVQGWAERVAWALPKDARLQVEIIMVGGGHGGRGPGAGRASSWWAPVAWARRVADMFTRVSHR